MFEEDYIMRTIREMVRALLKLLFHIDTESPGEEILESSQEKETYRNLVEMIDSGKINDAENVIYDLVSGKDMGSLKIALLFYLYLNDRPESFLEEHDFSREEVKEGLDNLMTEYQLKSVADIFLSDLL